jgi:hypothetical protein
MDTVSGILLLFFIFIFSKFLFLILKKHKIQFFEIFNLVIIFISLFLYLLINYEINYISLRPYILLTIFSFSIFFYLKTNYYDFKLKIEKKYYLILFLFFILSLSPPTDADSLDYHIGAPLEILRNNRLIFRDDWYHLYLMGYGEMINLLGLITGSKNFGQIINFISLINFFYVINLLNTKNKRNIYFFLFSIPLIIWFITSSKPQLYQSSLLFYCLYILLNSVKKKGYISNWNIFVVSIFCTYVIHSKISFFFYIIFLYVIFLFFIKKNLIKNYVLISISIIIIFSLPKFYLDWNIYKSFLFPYFEFFKINSNPSLINFMSNIKNDNATFYTISKYQIPFFPFIASIPTSLTILSAVLSLNFIFLYYSFYLLIRNLKYKKQLKISFFLFLLLIFNILAIITLPNFQPRYMLEIYWLSFISLITFSKSQKINQIIDLINKFQAYAIQIFVVIEIFLLLPGSFNEKSFFEVSRKYSHNFNEAEWILNSIDDKKSIILSENQRSYIFLNNFLSREKYFKFMEQDNQINLLIDAKFDYIVLNYPYKNQNIQKFVEICTEYNTAKKKSFNVATRNFLSKIRDIDFELILLKKTC